MKKHISISIILTAIFLAAPVVQAWDVTTTVQTIEPSYLPDSLAFQLNASAGNCAVGQWIWYYGTAYNQSDTAKNLTAIHASLMLAQSMNKNVEVHGDVDCTAINVHTVQ